MNNKDLLNKRLIKQWKKHNKHLLSTMFPHAKKKDIDSFLNEMIENNYVSRKAMLHNNYVHKKIDIDLIDMGDWIHDKKPIIGGNGVFFNNQNITLNPAATMLESFLSLRKQYKGRLKDFAETSYEYATFDRKQLTEKINVNSYYGVSGSPTSNFFNIYTASSVTATGQSLISTTETSFEAFMANNMLFIDLDDCLNFIKNIEKEEYKFDCSFLRNVTVEMLIEYLKGQFHNFKPEYEDILFMYLMNLSRDTIKRIYYKNNLYEFSLLPKIRLILSDIVDKTWEFTDPNKVPKESKEDLQLLWDYYEEFVLYNHCAFNRIQRLKKDKRKCVVVVDTDSNMLNLEPWYDFMQKYVININPSIIKGKTDDAVTYICVNIMSFVITKMITTVLNKYTKDANILKEHRYRINMKNEFLFTRQILANKKKRYLSSVRLREGKEILPEKIDIKGHDFAKSTTRAETKKFFTRLCKERILQSDTIDIPQILRDLDAFQEEIERSLRNLEKRFLIPKSVKEVGAYADPFREQGFRGVIAWNAIYPDNSIELPDKIDIVKVKMETLEDIEPLQRTNPQIYERIVNNIFNSKVEKISKKGIAVIAIPRNVEQVPEWISDFIDYDTITNDNLSRFHSVLVALGLETIKTSKKDYFSNIISF